MKKISKLMNFMMLFSIALNFLAPVSALATSGESVVETSSSQSAALTEPTGASEDPAGGSSTTESTAPPTVQSQLTLTKAQSILTDQQQSSDQLKLVGMVTYPENQQSFTVQVSKNYLLSATSASEIIYDENQAAIGNFITKTVDGQQELVLTFNAASLTNQAFNLTVDGTIDNPTAAGILLTQNEAAVLTIADNEIVQAPSAAEEEAATSPNEAVQDNSATQDVNAQADAADLPQSIDELFAEYAPDQQFVTSIQTAFNPDDPVTIDSAINFDLDFAIPDAVQSALKAGDYFTMSMPAGVTVTTNQSGVLQDADQYTYATYTIDAATNMLMITFTNNEDNEFRPAAGGEVTYFAGFDRQTITTPGKQILTYPQNVALPPVEVLIQPKVASTIDKSGTLSPAYNPTTVTWTVDANKNLAELSNAKISENFPSGLTYQDVAVYELNVDLEGNVSQGQQLQAETDYTVDAGGNVTIPETMGRAFRLIYTTTINDDAKLTDGGELNFTNTASLASDQLSAVPAQASVSARYGKTLAKSRTGYAPNQQIYNWQVQYNYGQKTIPLNTPLTDSFTNMDLVDGSVTLHYVSFDANGNPIVGAALSSDAYQLNTDTAGQLQINFLAPVQQNSAIQINYQTQVNQIVSNSSNVQVSNQVSMNGVTTPGIITETPSQQVVVKNQPTVDRNLHLAHWTIDINRNNYQLDDAKFTDTLAYSEQGLVNLPYANNTNYDLGVTVTDTTANAVLNGAVIVANPDGTTSILSGDPTTADFIFTVNLSESSSENFQTYRDWQIAFQNNYASTNHSFNFSYYIQYTPSDSTGQQITYLNNINGTWTTEGKNYSSNSSNNFQTTTQEALQGSKSGSYDPLTKTITWTILANSVDIGASVFSVNDPLTGDQKYVDDSLEILRGTTDANGNFVATNDASYAGNQVGQSYLSINYPNSLSNTLTLDFGSSENTIPGFDIDGPMVFRVKFKTSLVGEKVNAAATYTNTATQSLDQLTSNLTAAVSIPYAGETAGKSGSYDATKDLITWNLWVNRSQSLLDNPTIVDTPSNNQLVVPDSIVVYRGIVAANGTVTAGAVVPTDLYTATIDTNNQTGAQTVTVQLDGELEADAPAAGVIEAPYLISYQAKPNLSSQNELVTNQARLTSDGNTYQGNNTSTQVRVAYDGSSGSAWGPKGSVTLQKTDEAGAPLAGADLQLVRRYTDSNLPEQIIYSATTGADGTVTFGNLIYSDLANPARGFTYYLVETAAPEGYTISNELLNGVPVTVNQATSTTGIDQSVVNPAVEISFTKQSADGQNLAGGVFELARLAADGTYQTVTEYGTNPFQATVQGVSFRNLAEGTYRIQELQAPIGYLLNSSPINFSVALQSNGQRVILAENQQPSDGRFTLVDYQGSARLTKLDDEGNPLAGAVFILQDGNGQPILNDSQEFITATSDAAGQVVFNQLAPGDYQAVEVTAAPGYYLNKTPLSFTIADDATSSQPAEVTIGTGTLTNYRGTAVLTKIGMNSQGVAEPLSGAVFDLYDEDNQVVQSNLTSQADGVITINNLSAGATYPLVETASSGDYIVNPQALTFTMPAGSEANLTSAAEA